MSVLARIVEARRASVERRKRERPLRTLETGAFVPRSFAAALSRPGLSVVAEIKRRSPSGGVLRPGLDPAALAREYEAAGAAALSVLTEPEFFGGSDADLVAARAASRLPVLRKDFVLDPYQIVEARALGADAVLLIVRLLDEVQLAELSALAEELGLAAVVETHDERDLERAVAAGAAIVGVNSRDLATLEVDLAAALALRASIPLDRLALAESGIRTPADVRRVARHGFDGLLVGQALVGAADPGAALRALLAEVAS